MKKIILLISLCTSNFLFAQKSLKTWTTIPESGITTQGARVIVPNKYSVFHVNSDFKNSLWLVPNETVMSLQNSNAIIDLPFPDGSTKKYKIVESPCMDPALAAQFPSIKTFNVMGIDEPGTYGKLDWTEFGFHGMLIRSEGNIFIDPYSRNNISEYVVYYTNDYEKPAAFRSIPECNSTLNNTNRVINNNNANNSANRINGTNNIATTGIFAGPTLRTYRFAVGCTGEYAVAATGVASPTTAQILSVVTTSVNRVDGVYETEAAIKLVLVATETNVLFGNASTDPYTGNNNANTLITESQTVITANIGSANYDIGHTFSTGGGGLAQLGCVCSSGSKASGITGSPSPVGDPYDIDFVAHEVGHEFGGNHSYNQCTGNATQNAGTMVEPLSGVSIMGYAGVCATADNLSNHSIAYFHTISYDEIMTYSNNGNGNTCPTKPATGNHAPVVTGSATYTIPKSTPFTLTGSATDQDGDALTYDWEEIDNNSTAHAGGTAAPYFRNWVPSTSPSRNFPQQSVTLNGALTQLGEYLPTAAGTLNFRLVARDNRMGGGGVSYAATQLIIASSGPLAVTAPNTTGISYVSGTAQTVTWNVASTNTAPVSCANVSILLSLDGGTTWSTLLASTANDGTESVTYPAQATTKTTCRVKIAAVGNIFYDINDKNFTLTATTSPIASVAIAQTTGSNPMCPGATSTFTATPTNGGTAPTYQWQVNGANVGTGGTTYTTTSLTNGQTVTCIMTSNLAGVAGSPATSNAITITVGTTTPSVTIAGPALICAGASATYTATPVNGGTTPTYQWQINGSNVGTGGTSYTSSSITNGQIVTCIMTSSLTCVSSSTATSNAITVVVNTAGSLPFVENFEGTTFPPTGWAINNPDAPSIAWNTPGAKGLEKRAAAGNTGSATGCVGIECFNYNTDTTSIDELISKTVNLTGATSPKMTFKRAYKYYADATSPSLYHDELRIYVSTDCGATYGAALYYKKGTQLASNGTINTTFTPAATADWKKDSIDLTAYVGQNIIVKFEVTNRYGNNLYLDDINISSVATTTTASVSIAQTAGANPLCAGASATFTATPTNGGTAPTYQWKVNGNNVGTGGATYTTTTLTNGQIVTCVMTSNLAGVAGSPATSNAITMVVNAAVTPAVAITGNATICAGASTTFTAAPTNGGTTPTYQWQVNGNNVGTGGTTYTSTALTNGQIVTCVLTSNATCATSTTATSNSVTMVVNAAVTPTVAISGNNTICAGTATTFTAVATNGGTTTTYQWKRNGNNVGNNSATFTTSTLTNGQVITCVITSNAPCATSTTATSNSITMVVTTNVTPSVAIAGSNSICVGTPTTFTATPTNGGSTPSYQWHLNGNNVATGTTYSSSALQTGDVITCTMTGSATCATTSTANSNTITMTVSNGGTPAVAVSGNNTLCTGDVATFTATPSYGGSTPTYQWLLNGNTAGTGAATYSSSALANGDVVSCTMTSSASCTATSTATSNTVSVTVNAIPTAATITQNGSVLTSDAATGNQWYLNGNIIAGATSQSYTAVADGDYTVIVTNSGCSSSVSNTITIVTTGVKQNNTDGAFNIYPNPNDGNFTITFSSNTKTNYVVEIDNAIGQVVYKEVINDYNGSYTKAINLSTYSQGVYTVRLINDKSQSVKKIVIN